MPRSVPTDPEDYAESVAAPEGFVAPSIPNEPKPASKVIEKSYEDAFNRKFDAVAGGKKSAYTEHLSEEFYNTTLAQKGFQNRNVTMNDDTYSRWLNFQLQDFNGDAVTLAPKLALKWAHDAQSPSELAQRAEAFNSIVPWVMDKTNFAGETGLLAKARTYAIYTQNESAQKFLDMIEELPPMQQDLLIRQLRALNPSRDDMGVLPGLTAQEIEALQAAGKYLETHYGLTTIYEGNHRDPDDPFRISYTLPNEDMSVDLLVGIKTLFPKAQQMFAIEGSGMLDKIAMNPVSQTLHVADEAIGAVFGVPFQVAGDAYKYGMRRVAEEWYKLGSGQTTLSEDDKAWITKNAGWAGSPVDAFNTGFGYFDAGVRWTLDKTLGEAMRATGNWDEHSEDNLAIVASMTEIWLINRGMTMFRAAKLARTDLPINAKARLGIEEAFSETQFGKPSSFFPDSAMAHPFKATTNLAARLGYNLSLAKYKGFSDFVYRNRAVQSALDSYAKVSARHESIEAKAAAIRAVSGGKVPMALAERFAKAERTGMEQTFIEYVEGRHPQTHHEKVLETTIADRQSEIGILSHNPKLAADRAALEHATQRFMDLSDRVRATMDIHSRIEYIDARLAEIDSIPAQRARDEATQAGVDPETGVARSLIDRTPDEIRAVTESIKTETEIIRLKQEREGIIAEYPSLAGGVEKAIMDLDAFVTERTTEVTRYIEKSTGEVFTGTEAQLKADAEFGGDMSFFEVVTRPMEAKPMPDTWFKQRTEIFEQAMRDGVAENLGNGMYRMPDTLAPKARPGEQNWMYVKINHRGEVVSARDVNIDTINGSAMATASTKAGWERNGYAKELILQQWRDMGIDSFAKLKEAIDAGSFTGGGSRLNKEAGEILLRELEPLFGSDLARDIGIKKFERDQWAEIVREKMAEINANRERLALARLEKLAAQNELGKSLGKLEGYPVYEYPRYNVVKDVTYRGSETHLGTFVTALSKPMKSLARKFVDDLPHAPVLFTPWGHETRPANWIERNVDTMNTYFRRAGVPAAESFAMAGRLAHIETRAQLYKWMEDAGKLIDKHLPPDVPADIRAALTHWTDNAAEARGRLTRSVEVTDAITGEKRFIDEPIVGKIDPQNPEGTRTAMPSSPSEMIAVVHLPNVDLLIEATSWLRRAFRKSDGYRTSMFKERRLQRLADTIENRYKAEQARPDLSPERAWEAAQKAHLRAQGPDALFYTKQFAEGVAGTAAEAAIAIPKFILHIGTAILKAPILALRIPAMTGRIQVEQTLRAHFYGGYKGISLFPHGLQVNAGFIDNFAAALGGIGSWGHAFEILKPDIRYDGFKAPEAESLGSIHSQLADTPSTAAYRREDMTLYNSHRLEPKEQHFTGEVGMLSKLHNDVFDRTFVELKMDPYAMLQWMKDNPHVSHKEMLELIKDSDIPEAVALRNAMAGRPVPQGTNPYKNLGVEEFALALDQARAGMEVTPRDLNQLISDLKYELAGPEKAFDLTAAAFDAPGTGANAPRIPPEMQQRALEALETLKGSANMTRSQLADAIGAENFIVIKQMLDAVQGSRVNRVMGLDAIGRPLTGTEVDAVSAVTEIQARLETVLTEGGILGDVIRKRVDRVLADLNRGKDIPADIILKDLTEPFRNAELRAAAERTGLEFKPEQVGLPAPDSLITGVEAILREHSTTVVPDSPVVHQVSIEEFGAWVNPELWKMPDRNASPTLYMTMRDRIEVMRDAMLGRNPDGTPLESGKSGMEAMEPGVAPVHGEDVPYLSVGLDSAGKPMATEGFHRYQAALAANAIEPGTVTHLPVVFEAGARPYAVPPGMKAADIPLVVEWLTRKAEAFKDVFTRDWAAEQAVVTGKYQRDTLAADFEHGVDGNPLGVQLSQHVEKFRAIQAKIKELSASRSLREASQTEIQTLMAEGKVVRNQINHLQEELGIKAAVEDAAGTISLADTKKVATQMGQRYHNGDFAFPNTLSVKRRYAWNERLGHIESFNRFVDAWNKAWYRGFKLASWADMQGTRGSLYYQMAHEYYKANKKKGMTEQTARALAANKAAESVKDLMYDLSARSSFHRATKDTFWFAPAAQEIMYNWAVKIPSQYIAGTGYFLIPAKAVAFVNMLKDLNIIQKDNNGEDIVLTPGLAAFLDAVLPGEQNFGSRLDFNMRGFNMVAQSPIPAANTLLSAAMGKAGREWGGIFKALSDIFNQFGPDIQFFPRQIVYAWEVLTGNPFPVEFLAPDYSRMLYDRSMDQAIQFAFQSRLNEGDTPPRPENYATPEAYHAARDRYLEVTLQDAKTYFKGIAALNLAGATVTPASLHVTEPERLAWQQFFNDVIDPAGNEEETGKYTAKQKELIDDYIGEHPSSFAYTIGYTVYGKQERELPYVPNEDDEFFESFYTGEREILSPEEYSRKLMTVESYRFYQSQMKSSMDAIGKDAPTLLRNGFERAQVMGEFTEGWNRWLAYNPEADAQLTVARTAWSERYGIPEATYEIERISTTMQLLREMSPLFTGESGMREEEYRAVIGRLHELYDQEGGDFGEPSTQVGKDMAWWYENVLEPYIDETADLYAKATNLVEQGADAGAVYDKIREIQNSYVGGVQHNGMTFPAPEEAFFGNKTKAEQQAALLSWATKPPTWLTQFQLSKVEGMPKFQERNAMLTELSEFDTNYNDVLVERDVDRGSLTFEAYEEWADKERGLIADKYGSDGLRLLAYYDAGTLERLSMSGFGEHNEEWQKIAAYATEVTSKLNEAGYSEKGFSDGAMQLKVWLYNLIESSRRNDPEYDRLWTDLSYAVPDSGQLQREGIALYEAILFGNFRMDDIPEQLYLAVGGGE